jgi:hypothetical protein
VAAPVTRITPRLGLLHTLQTYLRTGVPESFRRVWRRRVSRWHVMSAILLYAYLVGRRVCSMRQKWTCRSKISQNHVTDGKADEPIIDSCVYSLLADTLLVYWARWSSGIVLQPALDMQDTSFILERVCRIIVGELAPSIHATSKNEKTGVGISLPRATFVTPCDFRYSVRLSPSRATRGATRD